MKPCGHWGDSSYWGETPTGWKKFVNEKEYLKTLKANYNYKKVRWNADIKVWVNDEEKRFRDLCRVEKQIISKEIQMGKLDGEFEW